MHGLVDPERPRLAVHHRLDRATQVDRLAHQPAEDVAFGQDPGQPALAVGYQHGVADAGALDQPQAVGQRGPRRDGQRAAPLDDAEGLAGKRRHALGNGSLGGLGHEPSVVRTGRGAGAMPC